MAIALLLPLIGFAQTDVTITVTNLNPAYDNIWVKGSMDGWAGHQMVQDGDNWTYTYTALADNTYQWGAYQATAEGAQIIWLAPDPNPQFTVAAPNITGTTSFTIPAPGDTYDVTFTVTDESQTETLIKIKGSMNGWAGVDMENQGGGVWTKTLPVEVGSWAWGAENGEGAWLIDKYGVEGGNRTFQVSETGVVSGQVELFLPELGIIPVTFNVDMTDEIDNLSFIPGEDILEVVGSFNAFQGSLVAVQWQLTDTDEDNIYTVTSPGQFRADQQILFKFRKNGNWDLAETPGDPDGKLNRKYTVTAIEKSNIYNAIWGENYFHNFGVVAALTDITTQVGATVEDLNLPEMVSVTMGVPGNLTEEIVDLPVTWATETFSSETEGEVTIQGTIALSYLDVTYFNGYNLKASVKVIVGPVSVPTNNLQFSMFPNPTSGDLNISAGSQINNVRIVNVLGQQVMNLSNLGGNNVVVPTSNLSAGVYIITINGESSRFIKK